MLRAARAILATLFALVELLTTSNSDVFLQIHDSSIFSDLRLHRLAFGAAAGASDTPPSSCPAADGAASCSRVSYVASSLAAADALEYRSAGILLYDFERAMGQGVEAHPCFRLLMGRNHENKIEFLGGKKEAGDLDVYGTAAREFDEESGGVLAASAGDISHRETLMRACRSSRVLWYALI